MANKKKKVNKNLPKFKSINKEKKVVKKMENKKDEIKTFVKITVALVLSFVILYFGTILLEKVGFFEPHYTPVKEETPVIKYDVSLIGTVFNRVESEYYVVFYNFNDETNSYFESIISNKAEDIVLYKVDMSYGTNKDYVKNLSNPYAQESSALSIKGETLIKIKNGKNVMYTEGIENIKSILNG